MEQLRTLVSQNFNVYELKQMLIAPGHTIKQGMIDWVEKQTKFLGLENIFFYIIDQIVEK